MLILSNRKEKFLEIDHALNTASAPKVDARAGGLYREKEIIAAINGKIKIIVASG